MYYDDKEEVLKADPLCVLVTRNGFIRLLGISPYMNVFYFPVKKAMTPDVFSETERYKIPDDGSEILKFERSRNDYIMGMQVYYEQGHKSKESFDVAKFILQQKVI